MLTDQFLSFFGHHAIGIVKFQIGDPTHVLLMIRGVEQMGKNPLLQFCLVEGHGEGGQWHG